jgi:hypothetical protein
METSGDVSERPDRTEPGVKIPVQMKGDPFVEKKIKVGYWSSGKLFLEEIYPMKFQYVVISHVWGRARWQTIPGIDGEVLASDSKATFLRESLPGIVGDDYFWMDILCVDQKSPEARVAITQHIPRIFRHAQRMVFVKDDGEIQNCCAQAIEELSTDENLGEVLTVHRDQFHQNQPIDERMLTRLWILEETLLSNTIQFVDGRPHATHQRLSTSPTAQLTLVRFVMKLRELAKAWAGAYHPWQSTPKSAIDVDTLAFIHGYFTNGTIRRQGVNIRVNHPFPEQHTFYRHIFSTRRTSKSRDFILATMPQYSFYHVPPNARSMNFGDLFKDCVYQLWRAGFPMQPIVPRPYVKTLELSSPEYQIRYEADEDVAFPDGRDETLQKFPLPDIHDVPEPACLGDLVKLFCGPRIVFNFYPPLDASSMDTDKYIASPPEDLTPFNPFSVILPGNRTRIKVDQQEEWRVLSSSFDIRMSVERIRRVDVVEVVVNSKYELLSLLRDVTSSSRLIWGATILGELHEIATAPDELDEGVSHHPLADERLAAKFLHS